MKPPDCRICSKSLRLLTCSQSQSQTAVQTQNESLVKQNQTLQAQLSALKDENLQLLNTLHSPPGETPAHTSETPEAQLIRVTKERDDLSM